MFLCTAEKQANVRARAEIVAPPGAATAAALTLRAMSAENLAGTGGGGEVVKEALLEIKAPGGTNEVVTAALAVMERVEEKERLPLKERLALAPSENDAVAVLLGVTGAVPEKEVVREPEAVGGSELVSVLVKEIELVTLPDAPLEREALLDGVLEPLPLEDGRGENEAL